MQTNGRGKHFRMFPLTHALKKKTNKQKKQLFDYNMEIILAL